MPTGAITITVMPLALSWLARKPTIAITKTNVAPKGSTVIVNPGEIHTGQASDSKNGWGYFMIYPHLSLVRTALIQLGIEDDRLPRVHGISDEGFGLCPGHGPVHGCI